MAIEQVRSLVADRHRYESWLEALDARRHETPDRVYARVRDDYATRRAEVLAQLRALLPEMTTLREAREEHLRSLEEQLGNLEDERAEAMLRTAVGEFDSERWDAVRVDVEGKLLAIGEERDALLIEVDEIRTLILQSHDPEAAERAADHASADHAAAELAIPDPIASVASSEELQESAGDIDVPMILDHVDDVEESDGHGVELGTGSAEAVEEADVNDETLGGIPRDAWLEATGDMSDEVGTPVAPPAAADSVHMVSAIESVLLDSEAPLVTPASVAPPADEWDEALGVFDGKPAVGSAPAAPSAPSAAAPAVDPFDDLAFLRSIMDPAETPAPSMKTPMAGSVVIPEQAAAMESQGTDAQKSLRCAECGTMNAPTEWYCERCGGELITI